MQEFARVCEQAARAGGAVLVRMRGQINPREKAPSDLVTEADLASQEAIRALVLTEFPDHDFLGEEDSPSEHTGGAGNGKFTWVVDPLDGTTNYVHGLENYCVSVALQCDEEIVAGCIFDPVREKCFIATLGGGANCNGEELKVSGVTSVGHALVAASLPPRVERDSDEVKRFLEVLYYCQALRRLGSAALNLCYVASGKLDAYWATSVKKWDAAAGLLIVKEAGGIVSDVDGSPVDIERPRFIASGHADLQQEMVKLLTSVQSSVDADRCRNN